MSCRYSWPVSGGHPWYPKYPKYLKYLKYLKYPRKSWVRWKAGWDISDRLSSGVMPLEQAVNGPEPVGTFRTFVTGPFLLSECARRG